MPLSRSDPHHLLVVDRIGLQLVLARSQVSAMSRPRSSIIFVDSPADTFPSRAWGTCSMRAPVAVAASCHGRQVAAPLMRADEDSVSGGSTAGQHD